MQQHGGRGMRGNNFLLQNITKRVRQAQRINALQCTIRGLHNLRQRLKFTPVIRNTDNRHHDAHTQRVRTQRVIKCAHFLVRFVFNGANADIRQSIRGQNHLRASFTRRHGNTRRQRRTQRSLTALFQLPQRITEIVVRCPNRLCHSASIAASNAFQLVQLVEFIAGNNLDIALSITSIASHTIHGHAVIERDKCDLRVAASLTQPIQLLIHRSLHRLQPRHIRDISRLIRHKLFRVKRIDKLRQLFTLFLQSIAAQHQLLVAWHRHRHTHGATDVDTENDLLVVLLCCCCAACFFIAIRRRRRCCCRRLQNIIHRLLRRHLFRVNLNHIHVITKLANPNTLTLGIVQFQVVVLFQQILAVKFGQNSTTFRVQTSLRVASRHILGALLQRTELD
mmetsp:Transcript_55785/g.92856  ORF Transcript_55785/g.92856 Transcript_55785/m.92856 type:complete len:394 (-) Transcript_55785:73-1254(-)